MMNATKLFQVAILLQEAVKGAGPEGIPSGHLYAAMMNVVSIDEFNLVIDALKKDGRIREDGFHLLKWADTRTAPAERSRSNEKGTTIRERE